MGRITKQRNKKQCFYLRKEIKKERVQPAELHLVNKMEQNKIIIIKKKDKNSAKQLVSA